MAVVFDYDAIEKITSVELVEELRRDVGVVEELEITGGVVRLTVEDQEHYVLIAFCTGIGVKLYTYSKKYAEHTRISMSMPDYEFIKDFLGEVKR